MRNQSIRLTALLVTLLALPARAASAQDAPACPAGRRPLLILGTFHMSGPGQDAVNRKTDMSTAQRQREMLELVEKLSKFRPTKIAIESARNSTVWNERYAVWREGESAPGGNEIEQIGFRLAKKLGLSSLTPVDYPMWMNGLTPIERHQPKPRDPQPTSASAKPDPELDLVRQQIARDDEHLAAHTIAEHLAYLNEPGRAAMNHRWDVLSNIVPGEGVSLYANADLAANWYKRNLRIFTNILDATTPDDRVLLIIGAGHTKILTDWAAAHEQVCLVDLSRYL